jgi:hypothetical protein
MRPNNLRAWVLACSAWLFGSHALAQAIEVPLTARHVTVAGELGYFGTSEDASNVYLLVPRVAAEYAWNERFSIAADWGVIMIDSVPDQGAAERVFRSGNPSLFGLLRGQLGDVRYRLGVGASVPVAGINRDAQGRLQHAAYNDAQAIDGLWDVWLWAPSRMATIATGQLAIDLHPELELELRLSPALLIPVFDAFGQDPLSVFIPMAVGLGSHKGPVRFGVRLQAVAMPSNNVDAMQLALVPWLRVLLGSAFIEARYTGNLDEPLAGERGPRIWGFHLGAGGTL